MEYSVIRTSGLTTEVLLTLVKLYQSLKQIELIGTSLSERMAQLKKLKPVFYIFYRDGTLFSILWAFTSVLSGNSTHW